MGEQEDGYASWFLSVSTKTFRFREILFRYYFLFQYDNPGFQIQPRPNATLLQTYPLLILRAFCDCGAMLKGL
jgi:hypothetical protein